MSSCYLVLFYIFCQTFLLRYIFTFLYSTFLVVQINPLDIVLDPDCFSNIIYIILKQCFCSLLCLCKQNVIVFRLVFHI